MLKQIPANFLPHLLFETDFVSILLLENESLLLVEWKRQITLSERKHGFGKALEFTSQHQIRYWLIDDLQLYIITPEEKEWVLTEFQDLASKTSILRLAVVTSDFYPALVANTEFTDKGKEGFQTKGVIQHEVFTDYESAFGWLLGTLDA